MNTVTTWQIDSTSSGQTEKLGHDVGSRLRGGEVIELKSDLGGGKTTFARGLVAGTGSEDVAGSPSFTVSKIYQAGQLTIHHYDFYRLPEAGLMSQELIEVLEDPQAVVIVEWAGAVDDILPAGRVIFDIQTTGETGRHITVTLPAKWAYLKGDD